MTREKKEKRAKMAAFCADRIAAFCDDDEIREYDDGMAFCDSVFHWILDGMHEEIEIETESDYDMARSAIVTACMNAFTKAFQG